MSELDNLNPFVVLRAHARNEQGHPVTQRELASLAGVSEQMITRQESGLINQPSARINEVLEDLVPDLTQVLRNNRADIIIATDCRPPELELITINSTYYFWVAARRATIKKTFQYKDFSHERNVAQLIDRVSRSAGLMPSVYAFCKLLAIHPYTVQSQLESTVAAGTLSDALRESGIRWGQA